MFSHILNNGENEIGHFYVKAFYHNMKPKKEVFN